MTVISDGTRRQCACRRGVVALRMTSNGEVLQERGVYCALLHYPMRAPTKPGEGTPDEPVTTAVTNLDVHDIARSARTYGLRGYFVVTPIAAQREIVTTILAHWKPGARGALRIPARAEALSLASVATSLEEAVSAIGKRDAPPVVVGTAAQAPSDVPCIAPQDFLAFSDTNRPLLLVFGTGHGLHSSIHSACDAFLTPIEGRSGFNHLSVRAAAAITFDRVYRSA